MRCKIDLRNCDNMELMSEFPDNYFDLAIVDPPYGIDIAKWDKNIPDSLYFKELFRVSKNQIIWGGNYFILPHTQAWVCWDKTYKFNKGIDLSEFELAWTSFNKKAKFMRFTYCGNFYGWRNPRADYKKQANIHPTQKPTEIYKWLLQNYANEGDKILDTHLGSGSIAIACYDMKFDLTGCELDTDYYNAMMKRYEKHTNQIRLDDFI